MERRNFFTTFAKINIYRAVLKRICKILILAAVLLSPGVPAHAGIRDDVLCLADSLMEGRGHASRGTVEASAYLLRRFRQIGLEPQIQFFRTDKGVGRNIIAVSRGDARSRQYTLVCAHYDGIGFIGGRVYPGADSNASGVAVLLYLAEALKDSGRNFVFVALDAHSEGLAGAETLAADCRWNLSMVVNLDTIGSVLAPPNKYRPDFLIALGGKTHEKALEKANEGIGLRLYYDYYKSKSFTEYFYTRISDQAPFLRKKVPAVMFTSGITMNTNKLTDDADGIDFEILGKRAELIRNWLQAR